MTIVTIAIVATVAAKFYASVLSLDPGENRRRDATSVNATDAKQRGGSLPYCRFDNNNINNVDIST